MKLTKKQLRNLIKEAIIAEGLFTSTPRYPNNNPWIRLTQENVKTNSIFIKQWGEGGFSVKLDKFVPCNGGWMCKTNDFAQTMENDFAGDTWMDRCSGVFVKKGNGQMLYGIDRRTGRPNTTVGVGLTGGYIYPDENNRLHIKLENAAQVNETTKISMNEIKKLVRETIESMFNDRTKLI